MPDTKCTNNLCQQKEKCERWLTKGKKEQKFIRNKDDSCAFFWEHAEPRTKEEHRNIGMMHHMDYILKKNREDPRFHRG